MTRKKGGKRNGNARLDLGGRERLLPKDVRGFSAFVAAMVRSLEGAIEAEVERRIAERTATPKRKRGKRARKA